MYVKVTAGAHPYGQRGDFLTKAHPPLYSDYAATHLPDAKWDDEGHLISWGDVDWSEAMGAQCEYVHFLEFEIEQTVYEQLNGMVAFRYVWWSDPETGLTAVITTRNIFIVGENGKTIDRVG